MGILDVVDSAQRPSGRGRRRAPLPPGAQRMRMTRVIGPRHDELRWRRFRSATILWYRCPARGRFRTGPAGRSKKFRFTSFGDQSVPLPVGQGLGPWSPNAGYVVDAVEAADPLFHLLNGDLCYANVSDAPVETWSSFFGNN